MNYEQLRRAIGAGEDVTGWASGVLTEIGEWRRELPAVRHPLGFLCLPVERSGSLGVCLHLWVPGVRPTTTSVHAHSWDLLSYVLHGTLRNRTVEVRAAPQRPTHRLYEIATGATTDEVRPTDHVVRSAVVAEQEFRPGDSYTLAAGEFHSTTVPSTERAATVALGATRTDAADLSLGPLRGPPARRQPRELCTTEETRTVARSLGRLLEDR